jgi:8-oxo-dGTP pyrophosphatase MutT (NUDIX family)
VPPALSRIERLVAALGRRTPRTVEDAGRKLAAVAVVLADQPASILIIRRAERADDRWSGQMAFPGGRWSPEDGDLLVTAMRETREEVGLDLTGAPVVGTLDDVAPRSQALPPIIVRPFVFRLPEPAGLVPNHEVAGAVWVGLDQLQGPGVYRSFPFESQGVRMLLPGYHLAEGVVWGMTERILTPLLGLTTPESAD